MWIECAKFIAISICAKYLYIALYFKTVLFHFIFRIAQRIFCKIIQMQDQIAKTKKLKNPINHFKVMNLNLGNVFNNYFIMCFVFFLSSVWYKDNIVYKVTV